MNKQLTALACMLCMFLTVFSQEQDDSWEIPKGGIPVFQGKKKIKSEGIKLSYAFAAGDKVVVHCVTDKGKKLKNVKLTKLNSSSAIWQKNDFATLNEEVDIRSEDIYTFVFDAKSMGSRDVIIDLVRIPGGSKDFNFAWMKFNSYAPDQVQYSVDSMIGYNAPVISQLELEVFDKYYYQNVNLFSHSKQILGQGGVHNSQAVSYNLDIDPAKVPANAKLKCYNYSLSSITGGVKHWKIADITVSAGALFLSPAGSFAAHGAMSVVGPQPGNAPVQYYMSNRESDIRAAKEIFSLYNEGRKITNAGKNALGKIPIIGGAIKDTKVKEWNEGDMSFNQKGKVTNLFVSTAKPPVAKCIIMGNPDTGKAKNTKIQANAIYYAPAYKRVKAEQRNYQIAIETLKKVKTKFTKTESYESIKF